MSNTLSERKTPLFFDAAELGKSLKEVGVDYLKVESRDVKTRWFHGPHDVDLFIWVDSKERIIKQQVSFCGQIVEWNVLEGVKTGVVIEHEMEDNKIKASEIVKFDERPIARAVQLAVDLVRHTESLEDPKKNLVLYNFGTEKGGVLTDFAKDLKFRKPSIVDRIRSLLWYFFR